MNPSPMRRQAAGIHRRPNLCGGALFDGAVPAFRHSTLPVVAVRSHAAACRGGAAGSSCTPPPYPRPRQPAAGLGHRDTPWGGGGRLPPYGWVPPSAARGCGQPPVSTPHHLVPSRPFSFPSHARWRAAAQLSRLAPTAVRYPLLFSVYATSLRRAGHLSRSVAIALPPPFFSRMPTLRDHGVCPRMFVFAGP